METYIYSVIGHTANAMASLDILHSEIALGLGANFEHWKLAFQAPYHLKRIPL